MLKRPPLIVSCDWSISPQKRWLAAAHLSSNASYEVSAPVPVDQTRDFFVTLRQSSPTGAILAGFDFPIGIPRLYAGLAEIGKFTDFLLQLGEGRWVDFYRVAEATDQLSVTRPFYPRTPGGTNKRQLVDGLGLTSFTDLLRACDHGTSARAKACEIFWTLGANQVGRAAIAGWRDILAPAMRDRIIALWPFDGELSELLQTDRTIAAEIYPAEIYAHLGLSRSFGKASRAGRRSQSATILSWCDRTGIALSREVTIQIEDGFGDDRTGEDRFDSFVGALGMIEVVNDVSHFPVPDDPDVRNVEGWILGMPASPEPVPRELMRSRRANSATSSQREPASDKASLPDSGGHARSCPACGNKLFARWPFGWDAHAAHTCTGVTGTHEERKLIYKQRYIDSRDST